MLEYAMNLWETKRWLFWLLLIPLVALVVIEFVIRGKTANVKETASKALEKDQALRQKEVAIEKEVVRVETKIEAVDQKLEERKVEDISVDWHKTFKPSDDK